MQRTSNRGFAMESDKKWDRTLFSQDESFKLMQIFDAMRPCINKCMLARYGSLNEMIPDYCVLHNECKNLILQQMQGKYSGCSPSLFSAAVHQYVIHQGLYSNPIWRVISAVFEYTSMELLAMQKQQSQPQTQPIMHPQHGWSWPVWNWNHSSNYSLYRHPHEIIRETHEKVHESHDKLHELEDKLNEILAAMQKNKNGGWSK